VSAAVFLVNNVAGSDITATQHTQPDEIVSRDAKRVKTGATPAVVVVKSREHDLLDISRTVCAITLAILLEIIWRQQWSFNVEIILVFLPGD